MKQQAQQEELLTAIFNGLIRAITKEDPELIAALSAAYQRVATFSKN